MKPSGEDALEERCAAGDAEAIAEAVALLESPHPYTRGRASEMLAGVPEPELAPLLREHMSAGGGVLWWRVLAIFGEALGRAPGSISDEEIAAWFRSVPASDPDTLFHAVRSLAAVMLSGRAELAARLVPHPDNEVALRAAMVVAEERALSAAERERLQSIRGMDRLHALLLLVEQGERSAGPELAALVPKAGPFAFHVLDTLEQHAGDEVLPALRAMYGRRIFVGHVAARAAGTAAVLGDAAALERLRQLRGSRRRDVRAVALAELLRVGDDADVASVVALVGEGGKDAPFVVSEAWRSLRRVARELVDAAARASDPDLRAAAAESLAHINEDAAARALLDALAADPDPYVREAVDAALRGD